MKHEFDFEFRQDAEPVSVGDVVLAVDEQRQERLALVTAVHGLFGDSYVPCINVVYVTVDPAKRDPYGAQLERMSSLQHYSQGPNGMPAPGRFWANVVK